MSQIKSRLYELYLIEEEKKGSKMVLTEKAFYDQYESKEEDIWFQNAYAAYKKDFKSLPFIKGDPLSFELFKKEIETNNKIVIETVFGLFILVPKR